MQPTWQDKPLKNICERRMYPACDSPENSLRAAKVLIKKINSRDNYRANLVKKFCAILQTLKTPDSRELSNTKGVPCQSVGIIRTRSVFIARIFYKCLAVSFEPNNQLPFCLFMWFWRVFCNGRPILLAPTAWTVCSSKFDLKKWLAHRKGFFFFFLGFCRRN